MAEGLSITTLRANIPGEDHTHRKGAALVVNVLHPLALTEAIDRV